MTICELCYKDAPIDKDGMVDPSWDLTFGSWICPRCQKRCEGLTVALVPGGCFAGGKPDPRARKETAP